MSSVLDISNKRKDKRFFFCLRKQQVRQFAEVALSLASRCMLNMRFKLFE